jgi:hypothetical protein
MDVEGDGRDIEGDVFGFAGPDERWVKVRVIGICLFSTFPICIRSDKTDLWVVIYLFCFWKNYDNCC